MLAAQAAVRNRPSSCRELKEGSNGGGGRMGNDAGRCGTLGLIELESRPAGAGVVDDGVGGSRTAGTAAAYETSCSG